MLTTSPSTPTTPTRRRRQPSPCLQMHSRRRSTTTSTLHHPPVQWGEDTIACHAPSDSATNRLDVSVGVGGEDEDFLSAFADHDFSSPSSYPSFTTNLPAAREVSPLDQAAFQPHQAAAAAATATDPGSAAASAAPPRRTSTCTRLFALPARSTTQLFASSVGESQNTLFSNEDWDEPLSQSSPGSFSDMMPPPPRLHHLPSGFDVSSIHKRQHTLASDVAMNNAMIDSLHLPSVPDDDLFGDSLVPQVLESIPGEDMTTIDLTDATEVPQDLTKPNLPETDKRIKISKFQCVICMDGASALTVTHCGHLYCAQCLHSSLHVETTKGKCPMCRAKIDMKSRSAYNTKTKGFWPLELKLMTATKKGKRKAEDIS